MSLLEVRDHASRAGGLEPLRAGPAKAHQGGCKGDSIGQKPTSRTGYDVTLSFQQRDTS